MRAGRAGLVAEYFQRCFGQELALREEPAHAC
jgi:cobaltochelatase CobS